MPEFAARSTHSVKGGGVLFHLIFLSGLWILPELMQDVGCLERMGLNSVRGGAEQMDGFSLQGRSN